MDLSGIDQSKKTLGSYANPITAAYGSSICTPPIKASSFELNPQLIIIVQQNCQYSGLPQEEPTEFLAQFLQIADTVHDKEVDQDVYRLLLFPFAVKDQAKRWLNNQPTASIKTWKQLSDKFLNHFYPPKRMTQLRLDIQGFKQEEWVQLDIFYYGLTEKAQMSLDHSAGGSIHMRKTIEEAQELIDTVARNQYLYSSNEFSPKEEVMALATDPNPQEQMIELNQQLLLMTEQLAEFKEILHETLIDVQKGEVTLRVNEDEFKLNAVKAMQHPDTPNDCMGADIIDFLVEEVNMTESLESELEDI
ncbi:hypothetical protein AHAS_Ahas06G0163100 [Arachis hypogaea]